MISGEFLARTHVVAEQASKLLTKISAYRAFTDKQAQTITTAATQLRDLGDDAYKQLHADTPAPAAEFVRIYTGYACSVCGKPQFTTPGGDCCESGHGGEEPSARKCFSALEGMPYQAGVVATQQSMLDSIVVDGGKYRFVEEPSGGFRIDRQREPWVARKELINVPGSNAFLALFFAAVELQKRNAELERLLQHSATLRTPQSKQPVVGA